MFFACITLTQQASRCMPQSVLECLEVHRELEMDEKIKIDDVYDKNLNFLVGSGASYGLFPTLALKIKRHENVPHTIETLATQFEKSQDPRFDSLFMHYYDTCIKPVQDFSIASTNGNPAKEVVVNNYETFFDTLLQILQRRRPMDRRCNIFTTNYDGCFTLVADKILRRGTTDFVINDGARGFSARTLQAKNFNSYLCQTGVFGQHQSDIPQLNLIHLHGSVYWKKDGDTILVDYSTVASDDLLTDEVRTTLGPFSACLLDPDSVVDDLPVIDIHHAQLSEFKSRYDKLPIVNPTKWKFHETVFEEHYYQMLRLLSYELEKPNAILITFGFSFADEHILNLVRRSISNPSLQVFVCCFNQVEKQWMGSLFGAYRNVKCITISDGFLDFTAFNSFVFSLSTPTQTSPPGEIEETSQVEGSPDQHVENNK